MKRSLLIAGGTVGGLGAVLSLLPPHLGVAHGGVSSLTSASSASVDPQTVTPRSVTPASPTASSLTLVIPTVSTI